MKTVSTKGQNINIDWHPGGHQIAVGSKVRRGCVIGMGVCFGWGLMTWMLRPVCIGDVKLTNVILLSFGS